MLPYLAEHMGARPALVSQLTALYFLAIFLGSPVIGKLSDRYGRRLLILLTSIGLVVSHAGMLLATTLWFLYLARALGGLMAGNESAVQALAVDGVAEKDHIRNISFITAVRGVGMFLGPMLGGAISYFFIDPHEYYRTVLLVVLLLNVVATVIVWSWLHESRGPSAAGPRPDAPRGASVDAGSERKPAVPRPVLGYLFMSGAIMYSVGTLFSVTALYVERHFSWHAYELGWLLGAGAGAIALSRLVLARQLESTLGTSRALLVTLGVSALAFAALGLVSSPVAFVVSDIVYCFGFSVAHLLLTVAISRHATPDRRGSYLGWNQSVSALGMVIGAMLGGIVFDFIDTALPYLLSAAILIIAVVVGPMSNDIKGRQPVEA